jgi:hypothetical protein
MMLTDFHCIILSYIETGSCNFYFLSDRSKLSFRAPMFPKLVSKPTQVHAYNLFFLKRL